MGAQERWTDGRATPRTRFARFFFSLLLEGQRFRIVCVCVCACVRTRALPPIHNQLSPCIGVGWIVRIKAWQAKEMINYYGIAPIINWKLYREKTKNPPKSDTINLLVLDPCQTFVCEKIEILLQFSLVVNLPPTYSFVFRIFFFREIICNNFYKRQDYFSISNIVFFLFHFLFHLL